MLQEFNSAWKNSRDGEVAYEKAQIALKKALARYQITNRRPIAGLEAELFYYYKMFRKQHLRAESASGLHTDFTGILKRKSVAIDVTTSLKYKKAENFIEVREAFGKKWEYYIGLVDLKDKTAELNPLMLPVCEDGNAGHFILLTFLTERESLGGGESGLSDYQMLIRYNPYAQDDDTSLEKIERSWNYIIHHPAHFEQFAPEEDLEGQSYYFPRQAQKATFAEQEGKRIAAHFRLESGYILSGIASLEEEYFKPADRTEWVTRLYWVHPHKEIKSILGNPMDTLIHNVGGVAWNA
jgi:hypothetical protein